MSCSKTGETILLAEDEPQIRDLIRHLLVSNGYKVTTAANGQEALDKFKQNPEGVDLVVTDIVMPGMDGVSSVKEMKRIDPALKVIYMSGFPDSLPPHVHIILKPFAPPQLLEMIRKLLDNKI
ncbi:response regulator [Geomonas agri]|uniref:response regulator n=1 Tax=Geomonas agri TaxID=2873702 RepID=UPI001CD3099E|nr:response regulator [Geomonas agri]